jgi:hypothetical protein
MKKILFTFLVLQQMNLQAQTNLLEKLMQTKPEQFGKILENQSRYELQIIYTQIDRDAKNRPTFITYQYGMNKNRYFYPASTVKFPAVLLALEKLNKLKIRGLDKYSTMLTDSAYSGQTPVMADTSAQNGLPSVAHYAKKILLVSDNDAYNRLYEFVGQQAFNEMLKAKGYVDSRFLHRLSVPLTAEQNRYTNPIRFMDSDNKLLYDQPQQFSPNSLVPKMPITKGLGYIKGDSLVKQPFEFTNKNAFPLHDQQEMLKAVLFPEYVAKKRTFNLTTDDYRFVYQYMSQLPSETTYPHYNSTEFYDSYCKFTMFGNSKAPMPKHIRVFNKVGDAYGFLLDNAYVVDFEKGVEFMLTAVMYCNEDQIFNDDKYDYDSVGLPFYANLGKLIYEHELVRPRKNKPNLSKFKMKYR